MRFRSEGGYFLGLLGLLLAAVIVGWLMSLMLKTYFAPRPEISSRAREAAGTASLPAGSESPAQYQGVIDQAREATRALSARSQEPVDASGRSS